MKIYTKTGDKGETSLFGGKRVPKYNLRIESYGTVDELNSHVGLLRSYENSKEANAALIEIQDRLFTIGSNLATVPGNEKVKIPGLNESDINFLENEIDKMNEKLPIMKSFVLPGGDIVVAQCHIARCVCRRAERLVVHLASEEFVSEDVIKYLNRLSDYLFVLSRMISVEKSVEEIPWKARI